MYGSTVSRKAKLNDATAPKFASCLTYMESVSLHTLERATQETDHPGRRLSC